MAAFDGAAFDFGAFDVGIPVGNTTVATVARRLVAALRARHLAVTAHRETARNSLLRWVATVTARSVDGDEGMVYRIREGETGNQDFTLYDEDGSFDGSAASAIALLLKDRSGAPVSTTGKVAWISAAVGTVRVNLAATDLVAEKGPYTAAFIVTLASGTYSFPKEAPDTWVVWK